MDQNHHKPAADGRGSFIKKLLINLSIMAVIGFVLVWIALLWLDVWTDHGRYEQVPGVKGLNYYEAVDKLSDEGFEVVLSDSVYDTSTRPGTVLDQNPRQGTKVKHGREIYLTVNAFSPKTVKLPQVIDVSERQARAMLTGAGFTSVNVVEVPSDYKGLVVSACSGGRMIAAGTRLPVNAVITLEVGSGPVVETAVDSVSVVEATDETADEPAFNLDF